MLELKGISKYYNVGSVNEMCLFQDFNLNIEKWRIPFRSRKQWFRKTSMLNIICGSIPVESWTDSDRGYRYYKRKRI